MHSSLTFTANPLAIEASESSMCEATPSVGAAHPLVGGAATVSAAWLRGVADLLHERTLDVDALFAEAGLDVGALADADARFASTAVDRLWQLAVEHGGDAALGIADAGLARPANFDVVSYVVGSSPTLLAGLRGLHRHLDIVSTAFAMTFEEGAATCRCLAEPRPDVDAPRARIDYGISCFLALCRWAVGQRLEPRVVELPYAKPADLTPYRRLVDGPLVFAAPAAALTFARVDRERPLQSANAQHCEMHERIAADRLRRLRQPQITRRVRAEISRRLKDGNPGCAAVAAALRMSERTLRRRLQDEGTTFHAAVDGTRRELAQRYLHDARLSIAHVAFLLGFSDQSNFFRACRRWFAASPAQVRARLARVRTALSV